MKLNVVVITLALTMAVLSGCVATSPKLIASIDSIGDAKEYKTYILLPSNKGIKEDDLQFKEYAVYVNRALSKKGFILAESFQKADMAIFLGYGIGDPNTHQYTYSVPTWGQTGVSSSTTNTNSRAYGSLNTYGNYGTYSGNTNTNSTTTYTPTYGVTGSTTHLGSYITYTRYIILNAVDLNEYKKSKRDVQLWKTTVQSTGGSGDLRSVFPIIVAASNDYIATNTGGRVQVGLLIDDARVLEIKGVAKRTKE